MNNMNNNKSKQSNITEEENTISPELSTTQRYMNSLMRPIRSPEIDENNERPKHSTPTCHSILHQRKSLPERQQPLLQLGENKFKQPPPPPPLNIKNRFGSTTDVQADNVFRSQAEEIARELHIVRKITNVPSSEPRFDSYPQRETNGRFRYDYDEEDDDDTIEYSNSSGQSHEEFQDTPEEPFCNTGETFKIARPILSRTTSVGRLVNNFESLDETRSLAGDIRPRSPPITNSQRRFGTLTRQRTHLGLGSQYSGILPTGYENEEPHYSYNEDRNGFDDYPNGNEHDENVGWGATKYRTGPTTGKFRGPTSIWSAKFFVPPSQPKPPLPPLPTSLSNKSYLQHSVGLFLFLGKLNLIQN